MLNPQLFLCILLLGERVYKGRHIHHHTVHTLHSHTPYTYNLSPHNIYPVHHTTHAPHINGAHYTHCAIHKAHPTHPLPSHSHTAAKHHTCQPNMHLHTTFLHTPLLHTPLNMPTPPTHSAHMPTSPTHPGTPTQLSTDQPHI